MSARRGVALLYCYLRDWWVQRQALAALGVEDVDRLDGVLAAAADRAARRSVSRAERADQIAALVAAAGG